MIKELQLLFTYRNRLKDLFQVFIPISPSDVHANSYSHRGARGGGGVEWNPSPVFFYILQYFETILPLVESLWSS